MNGRQTFIPSTPHPFRSSTSRIIYVFRLLFGGAVAGFFVGSVLGSFVEFVVGVIADKWTVGAEGVFFGGLALSVVGAAWGLVLGLTDAGASP